MHFHSHIPIDIGIGQRHFQKSIAKSNRQHFQSTKNTNQSFKISNADVYLPKLNYNHLNIKHYTNNTNYNSKTNSHFGTKSKLHLHLHTASHLNYFISKSQLHFTLHLNRHAIISRGWKHFTIKSFQSKSINQIEMFSLQFSLRNNDMV